MSATTDPQKDRREGKGVRVCANESRPAAGADLTSSLTIRHPEGKAAGPAAHAGTGGTRELLIRDLANKRLAAVDAWATLPLDQSAVLADEVWAEATWYVDQLLPHLTPQTPLPGTAVSAASTSTPLTAGDPARTHTPAGQGNPTPEAVIHARWHRALDNPDREPPGPIRDHIAAMKADVRDNALREAGQLVRDHVLGQVDAKRVADFLDSRAVRLDGGDRS